MAERVRTVYGDSSAGSWAPSSGTVLAACVSVQDDGLYITAAGSSVNRLSVVPIRLPRNCTVNSVRLNVRARCADASGTSSLNAYLRRATTNYLHAGGYQTVSGTNWQTLTFDWTTNPYTGLAWVVADMDAAELGDLAGFGLSDFSPAVDVDYFEMVIDYTMDVEDSTAITVAQVTTGIRSTDNSAAMTPVNITTASGDIVIVMEAYGVASTWTPTWTVDSAPISPVISYDIADAQNIRGFVVSGLSAGSHTIESINPSSGGPVAPRIVYAVMVVSGADLSISSGDFFPLISTSSSNEVLWENVTIPANNMVIGLFVSRVGSDPAGLSHSQLGGSVNNGGTTVTYGSGALQFYSPAETVTDTFGASWTTPSGRARLGLILRPASSSPINGLRLGTLTPVNLYYGDQSVSRVYLGSTLVFEEDN